MIILFLTCSEVFGQASDYKFGKISQREMDMTVYEKDSSAGAVVLFDIGDTKFIDDPKNGGYNIEFTRHRRIKIFKKSEFKQAKLGIVIYADGYGKTERITSVEAYTYNMENGVLKKKALDPETVFEEKINDKLKRKKFVFPDVQEGSVLEYKYVIETPFHFNLPDWEFQDDIPTIHSEYTARMIPFYEYVFRVQGVKELDEFSSELDDGIRTWGSVSKSYGSNIGSGVEFQDYVHRLVLNDVPAFKDESYITSKNDYIIKVDFQYAKFHSPQGHEKEIISTWPKLNESLFKHPSFGKYIKKSRSIAKKILEDELQVNDLDDHKKNKAIIDYVKSNYQWNGYYGKYSRQTVKSFQDSKVGSVADINLFMIAILNEAGIETHPVILSTRKHGKLRQGYPFNSMTNYVIAFVNTESPFLADATEDQLPYDKIPPKCFNEHGLLVVEDEENWVNLISPTSSLDKNIINIEIDPTSDQASFNLVVQSIGYNAHYYRDKFENDLEDIQEYFEENDITIDTVVTMNYDKISRPHIMSTKGQIETPKIVGAIVVKPFLKLAVGENGLTQEERTYPVDFTYARKEFYSINIHFPENYSSKSLPEPYFVEDELVQIRMNYTQSKGLITIEGNYNYKKAVYQPEEYQAIKKHLDEIVRLFNAEVILEKS